MNANSSAPDSDVAGVVPARSAADALLDFASAPNTLPALALLWAGVAWLGSQVPQIHAAATVTDGLARSELLALHALGMDELAWSPAAWLLGGLTAFAALTRVLAQPAGLRAAHLLAGVGFATLLACWAWQSTGAPPIVVDIAVGADFGVAPAWTADGGGLAPAPGRWSAACRGVAPVGKTPAPSASDSDVLDCTVSGAGLRHQVRLAPGAPALDQGVQLTWLSTATSPLANQMALQWQAKRDAPDVFALALQGGVQSLAPALATRLQPIVIAEVGPLLLASDGGAKPAVRLLASPDVLPNGRSTARVFGQHLVRVQLAPARSGIPLFAAFLALAVASFLALRRRAEGV